jgi:hypothetical protein
MQQFEVPGRTREGPEFLDRLAKNVPIAAFHRIQGSVEQFLNTCPRIGHGLPGRNAEGSACKAEPIQASPN